jgi:hypothetical protein
MNVKPNLTCRKIDKEWTAWVWNREAYWGYIAGTQRQEHQEECISRFSKRKEGWDEIAHNQTGETREDALWDLMHREKVHVTVWGHERKPSGARYQNLKQETAGECTAKTHNWRKQEGHCAGT